MLTLAVPRNTRKAASLRHLRPASPLLIRSASVRSSGLYSRFSCRGGDGALVGGGSDVSPAGPRRGFCALRLACEWLRRSHSRPSFDFARDDPERVGGPGRTTRDSRRGQTIRI